MTAPAGEGSPLPGRRSPPSDPGESDGLWLDRWELRQLLAD